MINVDVPIWASWFDVLVNDREEPVRHRVLVGGRGGAKSWTIARKLTERARARRLRILCVRQHQNSIGDSSKTALQDAIERMGMGPSGDGFFTFTDREIRGRNGSLFAFVGLFGKEQSIKSFEGYDICWVEEAASLSQASIDSLVPTIRRPGSEIWWSYNPQFATDPVDVMFRRGEPPPGSIIVEVSWRDNPWFPEVLRRDLDYDRSRDPEKYLHIWEGHYVRRSEAQVFRRWEQLAFEAPDDAVFRFGADWGFSKDPTVLVRCFLGRWAGQAGNSAVIADPKGPCLFVDHEAYRVGCAIEDTPALFAGSDQHRPARWDNPYLHPGIAGSSRNRITADSARPETISYMQARGFDIHAAIKGSGSVEDGIEFLKNYDIVVHPRCEHLINEMILYSWAIDRKTGAILPKLADAHNHVIDALRYALEGLRRAGSGEMMIRSAGRRAAFGSDRELMKQLQGRNQPTTTGWGTVPSRRVGV
jgi:phage terminase large subunit